MPDQRRKARLKAALVVQPDLFFFAKERLPLVTDRVWGAPDLVVEILSPHPRSGKLDERLVWFATYGVRECWLVHQLAAAVEVLRFDNGQTVGRRRFGADERLVSSVFPAFPHALWAVSTCRLVCHSSFYRAR